MCCHGDGYFVLCCCRSCVHVTAVQLVNEILMKVYYNFVTVSNTQSTYSIIIMKDNGISTPSYEIISTEILILDVCVVISAAIPLYTNYNLQQ